MIGFIIGFALGTVFGYIIFAFFGKKGGEE